MPELATVASQLGAECDPDDTLMDILEPLRAQHPVPLLVRRNQEILGTVGLEVILPAHSGLAPNQPSAALNGAGAMRTGPGAPRTSGVGAR